MKTFFGSHRLPGNGGYYTSRLDVDDTCDMPSEQLQAVAQSLADRAAWSDGRFYSAHYFDTPEGRLQEQRDMLRAVGYTIHSIK